MLYQKLLMGERPYFVKMSRNHECRGFEKHRHPEIELYYCIKGTRSFIIDKERYNMHEGDLLIIGSMQAHELLEQKDIEVVSLVINVGPTLLGRYFELFAKTNFTTPMLNLDKEKHSELISLLVETAKESEQQSDLSDLQYAGADVKKFIFDNGNRIKLVHFKDMQFFPKGPDFAALGKGNMDIAGIVKAAEDCGITDFIVEQDYCAECDPMDAIKTSIEFLKNLK